MSKQIQPIKSMVSRNKAGEKVGLFSVCSANDYVLRAAVKYSRDHNCNIIIEATSNQVNQNGGYTGMVPKDFYNKVNKIISDEGADAGRIILGGDHLGPIIWKKDSESIAMENAKEMVRAYTLAGFSKIHLDTSMRLGDDDPQKPLLAEVCARRGADLAKVVDEAFKQLKSENPEAEYPEIIVGSEVPVPGGSTEHEDTVAPTSPADFRAEVECFKHEFDIRGLDFSHVVAFVVQPGVEFGDDFVYQYNRERAFELTAALKEYDGFCYEGHSSDYQTTDSLKKLVEDGVAILKVGPALTFAFREALLSLELVERELVKNKDERSGVREVIESVLSNDPKYWKSYYFGTEEEIEFKKIYSYSDRCRYYLPDSKIQEAISKMLSNLEGEIPPALISQFFPELFEKYQMGEISGTADNLILGRIAHVMDRYASACGII